MWELFKNGLRIGLIANLGLIIFLAIYVFLIETYLIRLPDPYFQLPLKLGTVVDSRRVFSLDYPSEAVRQSWLHVQKQFDFFVIEYQLRPDSVTKKAPRLLNWCKRYQCVAHRMGYYDIRKNQFNIFTIDDWYSNNIYQNSQNVSREQKELDIF